MLKAEINHILKSFVLILCALYRKITNLKQTSETFPLFEQAETIMLQQ